MNTRYYINIRDDSGNNPDFIELSADDFETLQGWKGGGAAIFLPGGYSAVDAGAGEWPEGETVHKYLQFRAVRYFAIVAPVAGSTLATIEELSGKDEPIDKRPQGCRFRLADEGKPYPKSGCNACGARIGAGLGKECSHSLD